MPKVGIIAALEREVRSLVRGWKRSTLGHQGRRLPFFEGDLAYVVIGGIGPEPARAAAEALLDAVGVEVLISAGFVGALVPGLRAGGPLTPEAVIDAATGERFDSLFGGGVLVSVDRILRQPEKQELAERYQAHATDMEAAAVAGVARKHGLSFLAVKAVSEPFDFPMPAVERFIGAGGEFHTAAFLLHTTLRPWTWPAVWQLAAGNRKAMKTLCGVLKALIMVEDLRRLKGRKGKLVLSSQ